MHTCLNCDTTFDGNCCNTCGQKASTHRFTMHEWAHEISHTLLHVDGNFPRTVATLTMRGGDAIRNFLSGKRKSLYAPFLYALLWCGLYVVCSHLLESAEPQRFPTTLSAAQVYIEEHYYKVLILLMVLPMTLGSFVAYRPAGFNFAEHLVLNTYLMAQLVIADVLLLALKATPLHEHTSAISVIDAMLKYPYWFWVYWQFFRPTGLVDGLLRYTAAIVVGSIAIYIIIGVWAWLLLGLHAAA
jgi:hypothetical protein